MERRLVRGVVIAVGASLTVSASVLLWQGTRESAQEASAQDQELSSTADAAALLLDNHFERAVTADLQMSRQPAFRETYEAPGSVDSAVTNNVDFVQETQQDLMTVESLFPNEVSEACFIDLRSGRELARIVDGDVAAAKDLSPDESKSPFFAGTQATPLGTAYQSVPYVSGDTGLWVIGTATKVAVGDKAPALVHFETSVDSLRKSTVLRESHSAHIRVVEAGTGTVVIDASQEQQKGEPLGQPTDKTFVSDPFEKLSGLTTLGDQRIGYTPLPHAGSLPSINANHWVITTSAPVVATGVVSNLTPLIIALFAFGIPLLLIGLIDLWLAHRRRLQHDKEIAEERDVLDGRLTDLNDVLARAAAGDLDVTCAFDLGDERMTALAQSFDVTLSHLRGLVDQAKENSSRLTESASELLAASSQQTNSANEQSTAVTETTVTVEQLAATAAQIADTATTVAASAQETLHLTEQGLVGVRDSVAAMERMTGTSEAIATSSAQLGEKVNEIGRILLLIDELSEQTNLLALNAAIEAARAGEHGRGFAVVAAEVRKLAERAQVSTAQIQDLVAEIQSHTQNTVLASEQGAREAARGVDVSGSAMAALDRIATMVEDTTRAVSEISVATQQQRSASDQVVLAMGQVSQAASQFAAGSSQVADSARGISNLSDELEGSISAFGRDEPTDGDRSSEWGDEVAPAESEESDDRVGDDAGESPDFADWSESR